MKERLKSRWLYLLLLTVFWVFIVITNDPFDLKEGTNKVENVSAGDDIVAAPITQDTVIEQTLTVEHDDLQGFSVMFGTSGQTRRGHSHIQVTDETDGTVIYEQDVRNYNLIDNAYYSFRIDKQKESAGKTYRITVTGSDIPKGKEIACYAGIPYSDDMDSVVIDGKTVDGRVLLCSYYHAMDSMILVKICITILILLTSYLFVLFFNGVDEKSFLLFSVTIGFWAIILNPFCHVYDESTHFFRSYAISTGDFFDSANEEGQIGAYVADNYNDIVGLRLNVKNYMLNQEHYNQRFSETNQFTENPYMSSVIPLQHMVGAIGIFIGNLFHMSAVMVILLGRLCDYVFYSVFCYLAIKNMKYYKTLFFAVATLPLGLWLAGSFSLDPILISTSLLFLSICLKYYFEKNSDVMVSKTDMVLLLGCGLSIASVKYFVYAPILLFFFLIPKKKFKKKTYVGMIIAAILIVLAMGVIQLYLLKTIPFEEDRNFDVNVAAQIKWVFTHIIDAAGVFLKYFVDTYMVYPAEFNAPYITNGISKILGVLLCFCPFMEQKRYQFESEKEKKRFTIFTACIFIIVSFLVLASLYAGFSSVGDKALLGVQPRYLLPIIILFMLSLSNINVENKIKNYDKKLAFVIALNTCEMLSGLMVNAFYG
ncbi:MAG: DUF2142 domain-containing protein [Roseburia sp.]